MLTDPRERTLVSSLGWVDGGGIWILDVPTGHARTVRLGDAKYLSLRAGRRRYFAAVHHYDGDRLAITAHSFSEPAEVLSRCIVSGNRQGIEGPTEPWGHLPKHYVAYVAQPGWSDFALVSVAIPEGVRLQTFDWYDATYDKMYQGIVGVTEVPESKLVLVSVQRSSRPILYDPEERRKVGELVRAGRHGNPALHFRRTEPELWADDYDSLLKLEPGTWRTLAGRRLQEASAGTAEPIGQFTFDPEESICAVARPASGDVIGLDPGSLRTLYRARLGRRPLELALLRDRRVFARDWMSGDLLQGRLGRVWRA